MINDNILYQPVDFDPFEDSNTIVVPTTEAQRELWTNVQIGGHHANCAYNESVSLHLNGDFEVEALRKAVDLLLARHDALRATFSSDGMSMHISPHINFHVPLVDLSVLNKFEAEAEVTRILYDEAEQEFDLENGPLGRIKLLRFSAVSHQLIITFHHIVCDGWSLGIMMQDLGKMYSSLKKNLPYSDEPAVSYREYALDEIDYLKSEEYSNVEKFWLDQYKDKVPAMELPLYKPRPAFRTYSAKRIDLEVDSKIVEQIKKLGAKQGTSFIATLTAAFEVYLYRVTGSEDVVVGLAAAGQSALGKDNLVGHCVNLLPLKSNIDPQQTFSNYLKVRKPQMLDAYDNQRYTFGSLIKNLNLPRDPSRIPLVPVSFNVDMGITNGVNFADCTYKFTTNPRNYENFEFFINAAGNGNDLVLECTFNTDLFTPEMMELRMQEFVELLKNIVENTEIPVARLNILTPHERQLLFSEFQGNYVNYHPERCIHQLFEDAVTKFPDSFALVFENSKLTYRELNEKTNRLASYLVSKGVGPDVMVAVCMERSAELIISLLGILKAGGSYVPIDLSYPDERIQYVIEDTRTPLVITQKKMIGLFSSSKTPVLAVEEMDTLIGDFPDTNPISNLSSNNLAYVIYTSGSTGMPKGVAIEHYTVVNYIAWCNSYYFGNREIGNFGLYSSLSFDLTVTSIFCTLARGKTLTIFNQYEEVADILKATFSNSNNIDTIKMTPAHILLLDGMGLHTNKVSKAIVGGEELTPRHVEILRAINPKMEIVNEYGPTEATVGCVIKDVKYPVDALTIGKPIDNCEVFILDANNQPVPPGVSGRLFIAGGGLARGYHNRVDLTNEKFQILTVSDDPTLMYDSGDLVRYRLNGDIEFLGRIDDQVKIRGYRIELGEIENVLMKVDAVKEQVVIVREDEPGNKRLVAYIVLNENNNESSSNLRQQLKNLLPEYMIPSSFVILEKLPLTTNGKIDRKALPSPERGYGMDKTKFEEPKTPIEQVLANIWCDVLGLDKVGINDNFFELGGHSILGVKMFNEVEREVGVKVNLSMLFIASTIAELARFISNEGPSRPLSCLVPLQPHGTKPPLFCIHMHNGNVNRWRVLIKHLGNDRPLYAIQPVGLDFNKQPHTNIEEMAAHYIKVMREVQPYGPYNLAGLCFSGMVVFEMATLLQQMGEKVNFLGMINNYAPPENPTMYRIKTGLNKFMKMEMGEKFNYAIEKNLNIGKRLFFKSKSPITDNQSNVEEIQIDEMVHEMGHDLRTIHSVALLNYHPDQVYHGNLVIFRTADPIEDFYNEYLGWDRLVTGSINTVIIEGCDNDTIITEEPYNIILSEAIREHLERVSP